jgi:hypothetical protein
MTAPRHPIPPTHPERLSLAGQGDLGDPAAPRGPAGPDSRILNVSDHGMSIIASHPGQPGSILCVTVVQASGRGDDRRLTLRSIDGAGLAHTQDKVRRYLVAGVIPPDRFGRL